MGNNMPRLTKSQNAGKGLVGTYRSMAERLAPFAKTVTDKLVQLYANHLDENEDGTTYLNLSEKDAREAEDKLQDFVNEKYLGLQKEPTAGTKEGEMEIKGALRNIANQYLDFGKLRNLFANLTHEGIVNYGNELAQRFGSRAVNNALTTVPEDELPETLKGAKEYLATLPVKEASETLNEAGAARTLEGILSNSGR